MIIFSQSIRPDWDDIKLVSDTVRDIFKDKYNGLEDIVMMVSSELLENAIKYGFVQHDKDFIKYQVEEDAGMIIISVTNKVDSFSFIRQVIEHIEKIRRNDNKMELYVDRMKQIRDKRKDGESKLGFYRIAYEGKFNLHYKYKDDNLTIIAKRKI